MRSLQKELERRASNISIGVGAQPPVFRARAAGGWASCLLFCSNDYLGLAGHPEVVAALQKELIPGVGSGAAHLISGHSYAHHALEEELADFTGRARALLFSTGYMANQGL